MSMNYHKNKKIMDLKATIPNQIVNALEEAYQAGQSEDVQELKFINEEALKHAQEAYEFFKVVMNRFCITENNLESTTKAYLLEIGNQLEQIKGIKK